MYFDFHSHVLPNIDDGSKNVNDSLKMLSYAKQKGAEAVVATPHFYPQSMKVEDFLKKRNYAETLLKSEINKDRDQYPRILLGTEFYYVKKVCEYPEIENFCIENTRYILLEFPYGEWKEEIFEDVYRLSSEKGIQAIIAHPDRYYKNIIQNNFMQEFIQLNCILQINASQIARFINRKNILNFLVNRAPCVLGSDMHDKMPASQEIAKAIEIIEKRLGSDKIDKICNASKAILENKNIHDINNSWR